MDKDLLKTIISCITALAVALILAASVRYYTDGVRYSVVAGTQPVAYLVDKKTGYATAYLPRTKQSFFFSMPTLTPVDNDPFEKDAANPSKADDFFGPDPKK